MLARTVVCGVLTMLVCLVCTQRAQARIPMDSSVSLDGKEFLKGNTTYSISEYDAVARIGYSQFSPVNAKFFKADSNKTLEVKGNIVFSVHGFPDMKLQSLHFVPTSSAYGTEWKMDPSDIAKINAYYEPIGQAMQRQDTKLRLDLQNNQIATKQQFLNSIIIGVPTLIFAVAFLLIVGLFTHRRVKQK